MAAEEPSRIRGGAILGGAGGPRDRFVGETTKYVVAKAPCQVLLTAPVTAETQARSERWPRRSANRSPGPRDRVRACSS